MPEKTADLLSCVVGRDYPVVWQQSPILWSGVANSSLVITKRTLQNAIFFASVHQCFSVTALSVLNERDLPPPSPLLPDPIR